MAVYTNYISNERVISIAVACHSTKAVSFLVLKKFWVYSLSASYGDRILLHTILDVYTHFEKLTYSWLVSPPFITLEHLGGFV